MPVKGLIHYALEVPDPVVGETFYRDFGLKESGSTGNSLQIETSRGSGELLLFEGPKKRLHHIAFAQSSHKGFHHASYEVGSFDDVGMGGMWMREGGWEPAWGLGRHAIGSNVLYYIKDPRGSQMLWRSGELGHRVAMG